MTETPNPNIIDADTLTGEMRPIRRVVLALGDRVADLDHPLQDLALGQTLTEVGQLELLQTRHAQYPRDLSTACRTRSRSGRYSSSTREGGYGVS